MYRARRIGACLRAGGCQPGDTVLLFSELRPDAVCILLAGLLTGIRVAVLEHTADLRKHSWRHMSARAENVALFVTQVN